MNDSTIRLSADTSALTDSLSKIAEEMTAMKDAEGRCFLLCYGYGSKL